MKNFIGLLSVAVAVGVLLVVGGTRGWTAEPGEDPFDVREEFGFPEATDAGEGMDKAMATEPAPPAPMAAEPRSNSPTLISIDFKDGSTTSGLLVSKTKEKVELKSGNSITAYPMSSVKSVSKPISSMPPMGLVLKKTDVRDLIAFLRTLNSE